MEQNLKVGDKVFYLDYANGRIENNIISEIVSLPDGEIIVILQNNIKRSIELVYITKSEVLKYANSFIKDRRNEYQKMKKELNREREIIENRITLLDNLIDELNNIQTINKSK